MKARRIESALREKAYDLLVEAQLDLDTFDDLDVRELVETLERFFAGVERERARRRAEGK